MASTFPENIYGVSACATRGGYSYLAEGSTSVTCGARRMRPTSLSLNGD